MERDDFRNAVFARDNHQCVVCGSAAKDAHHIIERRLWTDGGYHLDNGASVCGRCHLLAEQTVLSCEMLREAAGIIKTLIPDQLYDGERYDKWGNVIHEDGTRSPGELFWDLSVQKVLGEAGMLPLFRTHVKHPRTMHLPWSEGVQDDDRRIRSMAAFEETKGLVVVTEKMDGEQTSMYRDHIHARSIDSPGHPTRAWVKNLWGSIAHDIPHGWRVCGENMWGRHSIEYNDLESFFYVHSIWDEKNNCLSWDETVEWAKLLGLITVPCFYYARYDEAIIKGMWSPRLQDICEGYVLRIADAFPMNEFQFKVAKFVRPNHVQTARHWLIGAPVIQNHMQESTL